LPFDAWRYNPQFETSSHYLSYNWLHASVMILVYLC